MSHQHLKIVVVIHFPVPVIIDLCVKVCVLSLYMCFSCSDR
jgi:hypothetical protein